MATLDERLAVRAAINTARQNEATYKQHPEMGTIPKGLTSDSAIKHYVAVVTGTTPDPKTSTENK